MTVGEMREKLRVLSLAISDARGCSKNETTLGGKVKMEGIELGLRQAASILLADNAEKWYEQNGLGKFSEESTALHEQNVATRKKRWRVGDRGWIRTLGSPVEVQVAEADSSYLVVLVGPADSDHSHRRQVRRSEVYEHREEVPK